MNALASILLSPLTIVLLIVALHAIVELSSPPDHPAVTPGVLPPTPWVRDAQERWIERFEGEAER